MHSFSFFRYIALACSVFLLGVNGWSKSVHISYTMQLQHLLLQRAKMNTTARVRVVVPSVAHHDHNTLSIDTPLNATLKNQKPRSLVILVPYITKHASNVVASLTGWSDAGDPCPFLRKNGIKKVDLAFWFNKDFEMESIDFRTSFKDDIVVALGKNINCFGEIKFLSAKLKPDEDKYPVGPSYQWYNAFLSDTTGLKGQYDYMFWQEHDVHPIREGFIDKLFEEVTFHGDFYVKGSIHRGVVLNGKGRHTFEFLEHINGNALYNFHDENFMDLIAEILELSQGNRKHGGWKFSMDISLWIFAVTNYKVIWDRYQQFAHKIVHSDFIQAFSKHVAVDKLNDILTNNINTFLIHGDRQSTGQTAYHSGREINDTGSVLVSSINTLLPRLSMSDAELVSLSSRQISLLIVIPFFEAEMLSVMNALSRWSQVGDACPFIRQYGVGSVTLEFWMNSPAAQFPDAFQSRISAALGSNANCFGKVRYSVDNISLSMVNVELRKTYMFYNVVKQRGLNYHSMFWHEPDVYPIRKGFIDKLYEEVSFSDGDFFVKGSIHRGNLLDPNVEKSRSESCRRNINALYSIGDPEFRLFLESVKGRSGVPRMQVDILMQHYVKDYRSTWIFLQNNAHKFLYSDFIQPHGVVLNATEVDAIVEAAPNSYWIQGQLQ